MTCYEKVETKIGDFFHWYGKCLSNHPWKIMIAILLMNGLLGIGMLKLEPDTDVARVYTPMNSQAVKDEERVQALFTDKSGTDFYSYQLTIASVSATVIIKPSSGNILDISFLDELKKLYEYINNTVIHNDGQSVIYKDICALRGGKCVVEGDVFLTPEFKSGVSNKNISYPIFTLTSGETVNLESLLAGAEHTSGKLSQATYLKLKFYIRSDSQHFIDLSKIWLKEFLNKMETYSTKSFDFAYAHYDSLSDELSANIGGDIGLFSATFTLMITYACFATFSARQDCVGNRMMLGFGGVLAAGLSIVAAFGLVSACGMSFVSIVGNVPFLIIGIGVDDMFILLSGLAGASYDGNTASRIGQMMRTSGVAITITSLTDVIAFAAGALSTSFKGVRNFCVYTGVAVIFCYINQATLFVSCLTVKENHINDNRHAICCFKTKSKEDMQKDEGTSKKKIFCCAGSPPKRRKDVESFLERYPRKFLTKFVLKTPIKIFIVICFGVYLGVGIWGAINLKQGLVIKDLVAEDSFYHKYREWDDTYYKTITPVGFYFHHSLNYSSNTVQTQIKSMVAKIEANSFISNTSISWFDSYLTSAHYSSSSFVTDLQGKFLVDARYKHFANDISISGGEIIASRIFALSNDIRDSQDEGKMMLEMRDIASESGLPVIAFSPSFIFFEQYVAILPQTFQTLGFAIAAVFVVTAFFLPHPLLLVYVIVAMGMIMTGIVGFMSLWGLSLSSITMIHLIMSVGFSVDFTAHICHAYMVSDKDTRNDRVKDAFESAGAPIFNGAVSSILGIIMLSFAKSFIFKSFFQVMLLVVLFGLAHAVFLLPVVLSFIGPLGHKGKPDHLKTQPKQQTSVDNGATNKSFIRDQEMNSINK